LNLDLIKYSSSNAITDYINCLLSCGCVSLINKPTRFSTNCVPSLLDHIYTNIVDEQKINDVGIALFDISDHLPDFINFSFTFTQWCVQGEASEALASGPPFWGSPLRYYVHKCSLFLVKDVLFTHVMCYKANYKQVFCFQRTPLQKL